MMRKTTGITEHLLLEARQMQAERTQTEPAPLPLLRDPVPVEGIDLDDTSRLWEIDRIRSSAK